MHNWSLSIKPSLNIMGWQLVVTNYILLSSLVKDGYKQVELGFIFLSSPLQLCMALGITSGQGKGKGKHGTFWLSSPLSQILLLLRLSMDMNSSNLWELMMNREAWRVPVHGVANSRTRLSDWTELNWMNVWWHLFFKICYSLMTYSVENLFICLLSIYISSLVSC